MRDAVAASAQREEPPVELEPPAPEEPETFTTATYRGKKKH
jgi:hypothetical protein